MTTTAPSEARQEIARIIARAIWYGDYDTANPNAPQDVRHAAWMADRNRMVVIGQRVLENLERHGCIVTDPAPQKP